MSTFEDLKKKAEAQVAQDKAEAQGWVRSNRGWLIALAAAALLGALLVKACGG